MAKSLTPIQSELIAITVPRMCRIWEIQRQDGVVLRFANHAHPIVFGGETFSPMDGFDHGATQEMTDFDETNSEIGGILSDSRISSDDLASGRYDDALLIERIVDYLVPNRGGEIYRRHWWIGSISNDNEKWKADIKGLSSWMAEATGLLSNRSCRFNVGDGNCGVNLATYTVSGQIDAIVEQRRVIETDVSAAIGANVTGENDNFFKYGLMTITSAANSELDGLQFEIREFIETDGVFTLRIRAPFDFTVGDTFTIYAGCDKSVATCKTKFVNFVRFGGDPFIPGGDKVSESPSASD